MDGAPNYGAPPRRLCPHATANGATVMNGPVHRCDEGAEDDSVRWPEYWYGRWFLHDHGGASIKHGLLLDPETDQDGGQPVYADSLRNTPSWTGNCMDSKFGPDGALYVQVHSGFFRVNPDVGLYKFENVGGPDTPARPPGDACGRPQGVVLDRPVRRRLPLWDFGDGRSSTSETPTNAYAAAGTYDVTLTVTYADGEKASKTIKVTVS